MRKISGLTVILAVGIALFLLGATGSPALAQDSNIERGAIYGGAAGLLFGDGLGDILAGATLGAGVGAVTGSGPSGESARESAVTGALYGGGAGLLFGGGLDDALTGALFGGAIGGAVGGLTN